MKTFSAIAAFATVGLTATLASAADFGGEYEPPREAYVQLQPIRPVLMERPYNFLYEENGYYYASPYPLPHFGLFPNWGPRYGDPTPYRRTGGRW